MFVRIRHTCVRVVTEVRDIAKYIPTTLERDRWVWWTRLAFNRLVWYRVPLLWMHRCIVCNQERVPFKGTDCAACHEAEQWREYYAAIAL